MTWLVAYVVLFCAFCAITDQDNAAHTIMAAALIAFFGLAGMAVMLGALIMASAYSVMAWALVMLAVGLGFAAVVPRT